MVDYFKGYARAYLDGKVNWVTSQRSMLFEWVKNVNRLKYKWGAILLQGHGQNPFIVGRCCHPKVYLGRKIGIDRLLYMTQFTIYPKKH